MTKLSFWPTTARGWLNCLLSLAAILMASTFLLWHPAREALRPLAVGSVAPDFTATTVDGQTVRLSDRRGQPVLLAFLSPTCEPSARTAANLTALQRDYPGLTVLAVIAATPTEAQAWATEHDATGYALIPDPAHLIANAYHPFATPFYYFLQKDGVIASVRYGEHRGQSLAIRATEILQLAPLALEMQRSGDRSQHSEVARANGLLPTADQP